LEAVIHIEGLLPPTSSQKLPLMALWYLRTQSLNCCDTLLDEISHRGARGKITMSLD
jgi:hypothetical protein